MFIAALFIITTKGSDQDVPHEMKGLRNCGTSTHGILFGHKNEP